MGEGGGGGQSLALERSRLQDLSHVGVLIIILD